MTTEIALDAAAAAALAEVLQGLASPTRLLIVARLRRGPIGVTALAQDLGLSQATVSNHLRVLRHAKLVDGNRDGRSVIYSLYDDHVASFIDQAISHLSHTHP
ncbi:ArsR/SmtB family transcription factor [Leifsonia sp. NPDC014704]|uniref:ArsR/SmtB family transcription factor n=1 Tax=Leifsonia sp. NPDC014704 TaxID=3364123 RepID=UPI000EAB532C